jgi:hypothetical protein
MCPWPEGERAEVGENEGKVRLWNKDAGTIQRYNVNNNKYLLTMLSSFTKNRGIDLRHLLDVIKLYKVVSTVQQCPQLNVSLVCIQQQVSNTMS